MLSGLSYVNQQQILRLGANEPQEWLAADVAVQVASGVPAQQIVSGMTTSPIEISTNASPYVVIYDASGKPIAGNGYLHGALPVLPQGVLTTDPNTARNFITWQPEQSIRQAIVIDPVNNAVGGYVVSGRSLAYTESEEQSLSIRTFIGWVVTMIGTFTLCIFSVFCFLKFKQSKSH